MTILTLEKSLLVLLLSNLVCAVKYSVALSPSCEYISSERKLVCKEITDPSFTQDVPESTDLIVITSNTLACDCALKTLVRWKETSPAHSRSLTLQGFCSSPKHLVGRSINDLSSEEIPCGAAFKEEVLIRKRRAVGGGNNETEPAKNQTYTPGAPVFPCDFEEGFCQWFQLIDDEFHWKRQKGPTRSLYTGPDVDHTTATVNGSYLYIETSLPRRPLHSARLVSPTLAAVNPNSTCEMEIYIHMKGGNIGTINIYQAPVEGFAVKKFSLSTHQGSDWFKRQIQFDSDKEFQVIIEGIRGNGYQGDIAIDDISFTPGCRRLAPSYVRLTGGSSFNNGRVEIYHQGAWGPVCRDGWSQEDSSVACRELGFNKSLPLGNAGLPLNKTFISTGLYNVSCVGNETSIKNCPSGVWSNNISCPSNSSALVGCSGILPVCPLKTHFYCPTDTNSNKKCISRAQLCDFTKDCWDGSDELNCDNYTRCDFNDTNLCGWLQAKNDQMDWIRHRSGTPSVYTGPSTDHLGSPYSYYLYIEVSGRHGGEKARILTTPRFQGDNNGLCKVRFYYHMFGIGIGTLRVLAADRYSSRTLWSKSFSQNVNWTRAEVQLAKMSSSFIVMFEGEHGGRHPFGDIAIDDVSFSPECRPTRHENVSCKAGTLHCGSGECIPLSLQCDFNDDCFDGTDELNCGLDTPGRCDFEADLCHWQNMTDDKFDWQRHSGNTPSVATGPMYDHTVGFGGLGHYLYIEASSPRVYGDKARLISPQFMWKNAVNCALRFYYHMKGFLGYHTIGRLRVRLKNSITGVESAPLWERSGHQGDQWIRADVAINTSWPVTQVIFEAVRGLTYHGDISIDDISFSPECYVSEAVHIYKNYDVRLVDGVKGSFEGRVEVYRVGSWGTICDDEWGLSDANVVCKQLGYASAINAHGKSYFGEGTGRIWLDDLACMGNETNIGQCLHGGWGSHDCTHKQDAGVVCDKDGGSATRAIRLLRNNSKLSGQVEIYHSGSWEAICYDTWDIHDASVACRQLGYSGATGITRETPRASPVNGLNNLRCKGNENALGDCVRDWTSGSCGYGFAGVTCSAQGTAEGNIRLRGGSSENEGRVEVFHQGEWGTVCDDNWKEENARVVCYELGFTSVRKALQSFGPGSGRVWMDQVNCNGSESAFVECPNSGWGNTACTHQEDVGVICSDEAYIGCYKDTVNHVMTHELTAASMTPVKCIRRCQSKGYPYAGLEWANECYCGSHYDRYGNATSCTLSCFGDASKICGGPWALSVYDTNPAIIPTGVPGHPAVTQSCTTRFRHRIFNFLSTLTDYHYGGDHRSGWISTPNFPSNYQDNTDCIWVLKLLPNTQVRIKFERFLTEPYYDFVEIRDGEKYYSQYLTPVPRGFNGNLSLSTSVTASSNVMWIKFHSDTSVNRQGFNLTYEAVGASTEKPPVTASTSIPPSELPKVQFIEGGCNGITHTENTTFGYLDWYHNTGFVKSPDYPSNYPHNQLCRWSIQVAPGFRILATVKQADLAHAAQSGGLGDTLHLDDGISAKTSIEHSAPWEFLSNSSLVRIIFITDSANAGKGFYIHYERVSSSKEITKPAVENTNAPNKGDKGKQEGMGGGTVALIVIPIILVIIAVIFFLIFYVKKKKRGTPGVRHFFVNEAYDNLDSMAMGNTNRGSSEYPEPVTPNGTHPSAQTAPRQDPAIYFTAAPPPYSQGPSEDILLVPFPATTGDRMIPVGIDNAAYAGLYAAPPAYEATVRTKANGTTTTGIGSVTSLREAARDDGTTPPARTVQPAGLYSVPLSRTVLPPIRGTHGTPDQEKKQYPQEEEAGSLKMTFSLHIVLAVFFLSSACQAEDDDFDKDDLPSAKRLLQKIVPLGSMPSMPDGFPSLSELKTDNFDYNIKKGKVTVVADLEDPVKLLGQGMTIDDVKMTFKYDRNNPGGKWSFNAEGKWNQGNMTATVKIEESKIGDHHTMVAAADKINVYEVATGLSERKSVEHAGMNVETLKNLTLQNVEMYSVFKGNEDYVFMISGEPLLADTRSSDCKVFIRKMPKKKSIFSVLLEFDHDLPSRALLKLVSDDLFKIPFINHLIAKTRVFRKTRTNFGFVASTGDVDKLPLKSFGEGILANELQSHISKGLTLLLPFRLGNEDTKPVKVAVVVNPPLVKFVTSRHEDVSVAQTLKALSPSARIRVLPHGFPKLSDVKINHFTYNIKQETFTVHANVPESFAAIPGLLNVSDVNVTFRHRIADEFNTWSFEGHGVSELGGAKANISLKTEDETKVVFISGEAEKMSVRLLAQQYGLNFIPDAESQAIVQNSQMSDFDFITPRIKSATSEKQKNRYIHISGLGNFPGVDKTTEAEAVVYEDKGQLKTSVGFIFPKIPMPYIIEALTGIDVENLKRILKNSFNTSLVLSLDDDESLFENPTLSGLSFERGISMVGLFRMPVDCRNDNICVSAKSMLESDQWYRVQGLVKRDGFTLAGLVNRNYVLGNGLVLKDNMLQIAIKDYSTFNIQTKMSFPKEELTFYGNINFENGSAELTMQSQDAFYRSYRGGYLTFDQLSLNTEIMNSIPLQKLSLTARMTLGTVGSGHEIMAPCSISYNAMEPELSYVDSTLTDMTIDKIVQAMEIPNATLPYPLAYAIFPNGLDAFYHPTPNAKTNFTMRGKLHIFDRTFDCAMKLNDSQHIHLMSNNTKAPFVLSNGFIVVQQSKAISKSGPKLDVSIAPFDVQVKLKGFARVLGAGSLTEIKISEAGTEFPVEGNLFDITSTGLYISSPEALEGSETSSFQASGCLPGIHEQVLKAVDTLLKAAAVEADSFINQATENLKEAKNYYRKATKNEEFYREKLEEEKEILDKRNKEVWMAEERYNSSCQLDDCKKSCIGCPDWNRCCARDVFGSCVECPSWNKCCYKSGDPVCVAKNHGCTYIRRVADGNLEDARDIYLDQKRRVDNLTQSVFDSEFSKGKTKAVLDAAGKALSLIDRDSTIGIEASDSIKHYGLENVLKIQSICFQAPVDTLATSCINMTVNASVMGSDEIKSLPFHACLNKELVPRMARFLANYLFPDIGATKQRRSLISEEKTYIPDDETSGRLTDFLRGRGLLRRARDAESTDERDSIEPFWDLIQQHDPLKVAKKAAPPGHPTMNSLKRKWKIPASKAGRCKIYHQLLDICRDMMKTVKKMYGTYMYERYLFAKEKDRFSRKLKRVTKQLELSAKEVSGTEDQMERIERSLNFVSDGVKKWSKKSEDALKRQEAISVEAWVKAMDSRIISLGGEGVQRFLGNLFRAFDGLFESSSLPSKYAGKAITVMQRVRQIKGAFEQIFTKNITLGRANYHADRVLYDIAEIADVGIYCHKK